MSKADTIAADFLARAATLGFTVSARNTVVSVYRSFTPGDLDAYCRIESDSYSLLRMLPVTQPGSTWGSDSGSVGGHIAVQRGHFEMNKSGISKRVIAAIVRSLL